MPMKMASNVQQKNPITNLTRNEEALLSPTEKVIASGRHNEKNALQKIEDHEKLCRIMQKQTHDKIQRNARSNKRLKRVLDCQQVC